MAAEIKPFSVTGKIAQIRFFIDAVLSMGVRGFLAVHQSPGCVPRTAFSCVGFPPVQHRDGHRVSLALARRRCFGLFTKHSRRHQGWMRSFFSSENYIYIYLTPADASNIHAHRLVCRLPPGNTGGVHTHTHTFVPSFTSLAWSGDESVRWGIGTLRGIHREMTQFLELWLP